MNDLWGKVKNAGKFVAAASQKTKLKAEIALVDREINSRKHQFGVEMYDLMEQKKTFGGKSESEPKIIECFEKAESDIKTVIGKKDEKQGVMDNLDSTRSGLPAETVGEKAKKVGQQAQDLANKGKMKAEMALLDRDITGRKQLFGIELFDLITKDNIELTDTELKAIFDSAKQDISVMQSKKDVKQEEMNVVEAEQNAQTETASNTENTV